MGRHTMDYDSLKATKKCFCSSSGSIASATSSSSSRSSGGKHGFRTVHLRRQNGFYLESSGRSTDQLVTNPRPGSFGFSFRGGREFGTGFFVSAVEFDSEAQLKGLKVGDQIIRINGLSVEDATHQEVLQLAQSHHQLTLMVKSVGLIPVKDKSDDPLTWKVVESCGGVEEAPALSTGTDVDRLRIEIPENCQLGCGICKGPDWRPGIFIQYTKPNSLARRCGLQPGDQILQCNKVSFLQIDFSHAVSVLKNTRTLDLILKKGSGVDLFPGESSGYSSSSSIADEAANQSSLHTKRLSIVAEESDERHHRKGCHCKHTCSGTLKSSGSVDSVFDCVSTDELDYRERSKSIEILTDTNCRKSVTFKNQENVTRTLVNITDPQDSCHRCAGGNQTVIKIESNDVSHHVPRPPTMSLEKKIGDGLISVEVHRSNDNCPDKVPIEKSPSSSSFSSASSLSSAISQEIQRRNERKMKGATNQRDEKSNPMKTVSKLQNYQHDLLIAELKKKQGWEEKTFTVSTQTDKSESGHLRIRALDGNVNRIKPEDVPPCPTPDYYSDASLTDQSIETSQTVRNSILKFEEKNRSTANKTVTFGQTSTKEITPIKNLPKMTDKKSEDLVEMQSIDSCDLQEPKTVAPKPPSTYFQAPSEAKKRTTVIKITEYPTEKRREPVKFDFLRRDGQKEVNGFDTELASTLSRSNLRSKLDAFVNIANGQTKSESEGEKTRPTSKVNGFRPSSITLTSITENQLTAVKKTLKTFEKTTGNTVLLKIPKRN